MQYWASELNAYKPSLIQVKAFYTLTLAAIDQKRKLEAENSVERYHFLFFLQERAYL